jgi:hypothetical protein
MNPARNVRNVSLAWRGVAALVISVLAVALIGCGERRAKPVDVELARATLIDVLNHWKQGGAIDDLRKASPEIVVQEAIWTGGKSLDEFTLADQGRTEDANWYCEVELTLSPRDGGPPVKKTVTYVVGTDPVLTVFHAIL